MKLPITKQELEILKRENKRGIIRQSEHHFIFGFNYLRYTYTSNEVLNLLTDKRWGEQESILHLMNKDEVLSYIEAQKTLFPKATHYFVNPSSIDIMTPREQEIYNVFAKYIISELISSTKYAEKYAEEINVAYDPIEFGFNRLKQGEKITSTDLAVFVSFLNEAQKNDFFKELFSII